MKKSAYNIALVILAIVAVVAATVILYCLFNSKDKFRMAGGRGGGFARGGTALGGRGGMVPLGPGRRRARWPWWWWGGRPGWGLGYPYSATYYNVYQSPPSNYGNCECSDGRNVKNNCLYGNPSCDGDYCICGGGGYWGCDNNDGSWCEPGEDSTVEDTGGDSGY